MTETETEKPEQTSTAKAAAAPSKARRRDKGGSSRIATWLRSIWRHRWLSLATAWAFCFVGWTAVALWPNNYLSSAVIYADVDRLIEQEALPRELQSEGSSDQEPAALLKSTLLDPAMLDEVVAAVQLDDQSARSLDEDIMIRATVPSVFVTAYDHENPDTAHQVLAALLASFKTQIGKTASEQADNLEQEIEDFEAQLANAETQLEKFKRANADVFAETADPAGDIEELRSEVVNLRKNIARAIIERDQIAQELAELPRTAQTQSDNAVDDVIGDGQVDELAALQEKLGQLRERYADTHPYVLAVVEAIEAVEAQDDVVPQNGTDATDNDDLATELAALKRQHAEKIASLADLNNELASKQREIDGLSTLTETTSSVEAEYAKFEAKRDDLKTALAEVVARRDNLRQKADEQVRQDETDVEQASFRLINEPNLPNKPTGPSRLLCLALVFLGGIGIGGGSAVFLNHYRGVFESAWQLKQRFDVGVLGTVSEVLSPAERKQLGYSRLVFGLGSLGLVSIFGGLAMAEFLNLLTPWGDRLRTQLLG